MFSPNTLKYANQMKTEWEPVLRVIREEMLEYIMQTDGMRYSQESNMMGACVLTSCVVKRVMSEKYPDWKFSLVANNCHCFCIGRNAVGRRLLIDLTATQFSCRAKVEEIEVKPFVNGTNVEWYPGFWDYSQMYASMAEAVNDFEDGYGWKNPGDYEKVVGRIFGRM
jgi:hypothetical protein